MGDTQIYLYAEDRRRTKQGATKSWAGIEGKCRVQSQRKQEKMRPRAKEEGLSWDRMRTGL